MACFHPIPAFRLFDGSVTFSRRGDVVGDLSLPCGQCIGCRLERSRQWAVRCLHEASLSEHNSFITLTYQHLPVGASLDYSHFQKFFKRLRRSLPGRRVRFYMCGEYGELNFRPHFHSCIFGYDFPDRELFSRSPAGSLIYRSKHLESLWDYGFSSVGDLTFESAAYVARYVMKKVTGPTSDRYYEYVDNDTGEIRERVPEFNRMSLKPGIGAEWYRKYKSDVFPHDRVVVNGHACSPPRYYYKLLQRDGSTMADDVEYKRYLESRKHLEDGTEERLKVREQVTKARIRRLKKSI